MDKFFEIKQLTIIRKLIQAFFRQILSFFYK
jgi:hypothetical protein